MVPNGDIGCPLIPAHFFIVAKGHVESPLGTQILTHKILQYFQDPKYLMN